jgi:hypothetical protein
MRHWAPQSVRKYGHPPVCLQTLTGTPGAIVAAATHAAAPKVTRPLSSGLAAPLCDLEVRAESSSTPCSCRAWPPRGAPSRWRIRLRPTTRPPTYHRRHLSPIDGPVEATLAELLQIISTRAAQSPAPRPHNRRPPRPHYRWHGGHTIVGTGAAWSPGGGRTVVSAEAARSPARRLHKRAT